MPNGTTWIPRELRRLHADRYSPKGFDVDDDGELSRDELIATHNDNTIPGNDRKVVGDWTDWLAFYRAHASALTELGGIFKFSTRFKPTSPLHYATTIESPMLTRGEIGHAYQLVLKVLERFRSERTRRVAYKPQSLSLFSVFGITIPDSLSTVLKRYRPSQRATVRRIVHEMSALQRALQAFGYRRYTQLGEKSSTRLINAGKMVCVQATLFPLILGHERGWPLYAVPAPGHIFPRWDNRKRGNERIALNIELLTRRAIFPTDATERRTNGNLSSETLSKTSYFKTQGDTAIIATHIMHRGINRMYRGMTDLAIKDLKTAIKLTPKTVEPYVNLGVAYLKKGNYEKALESYEKAEALGEEATRIYLGRSLVYKQLGMIARMRRNAQLALHYGHKLSSKITWITNNLPKLKAFPHIHAGAQVRIGKVNGETAADGRIGLGLRWNLGQFYRNVGIAFLASAGFGFGGKSSTSDLTAGFSLTVEGQRSSLSLDLGLGYNFVLNGDPAGALMRKGGLVMAGLRYHYEFSNHFGIGLNLLLQAGLGKKQGIAVLPGVQLTYDF